MLVLAAQRSPACSCEQEFVVAHACRALLFLVCVTQPRAGTRQAFLRFVVSPKQLNFAESGRRNGCYQPNHWLFPSKIIWLFENNVSQWNLFCNSQFWHHCNANLKMETIGGRASVMQNLKIVTTSFSRIMSFDWTRQCTRGTRENTRRVVRFGNGYVTVVRIAMSTRFSSPRHCNG